MKGVIRLLTQILSYTQTRQKARVMKTVLFVVCSIVNTGARIYDVGDRVSQGEGICKNEIYCTMKPGRAEFVHSLKAYTL